jgi:hypothetical protein
LSVNIKEALSRSKKRDGASCFTAVSFFQTQAGEFKTEVKMKNQVNKQVNSTYYRLFFSVHHNFTE